jgi:alcohol dehydrogenase (cytochrome c)
MTRTTARWIAALAVVLITAPSVAQQARPYSEVTQVRLENPEPRNWLMFRRTYDANGYSPLDQIHTKNVKRLAPAWTFATGLREGHQSPPIVNDGVMFVTTPHNHVIALDARTGEQLWRYERELPEDLQQLHPTNRGVALWGDRVYMATADAFLVALDARTGAVIWEQQIEDYARGYYCTLAPLAVKGKILVGVSGGELGIRGFIAAFDAGTGEPAWKTFTVPAPGEPGSETWPGDSWKTGGVPVWVTGAYDPALGLTYWGTGNGGPWAGDARAGDNLYANSVLALDVESGRIAAHHQYHWNDSWDWDEVSTPLLLDFERGGRTIHGLVHPGRNGYLWFLERAKNAIRFVDAQPFVRNDVFTRLDSKTGRPEYDLSKKPAIGKAATFCPSLSGGTNWMPSVYSPKTKLLYIPANENLCAKMKPEPAAYQAGQLFTGTELVMGETLDFVLRPEAKDHIGEIQAWRIDGEPKEIWKQTFKSHNWGPLLVTGGGLVFSGGTNDRFFRAHDARTGELLWQQRTSSGVVGVPTAYEIDGVQYVAVLSGWGVDAERIQGAINGKRPPEQQVQVPQGGVLWVFALPGRAAH